MALLVAGAMVFSSCKRDRVTFDGELYTAVDNGFAESEFSAIRSLVDTEARADSNVYGKSTGTTGYYCPGAVVTVTNLSATGANMTVDFGTGANCLDGRLRTGKLHGVFSGKWKDVGSSVVITPENYTVSGYAFSFTETITYQGLNTDSDPYWTTVVTNAVLTHASNGMSTWNCNRTTVWTEGSGDLDPSNNVYEVFGQANGVARNNIAYTVVVDQAKALRAEVGCQWVVSGQLELTPKDYDTRTIDYGNGACDNKAVLTVGNYTSEITLP